MAEIKGTKITLIGGGGFIGHNLALHLKKLGANVDIIDSLQVNNLYAFGHAATSEIVSRDFYVKIINQRLDLLREHNIPLHLQDARDYHALSRIIADINPEVIIHLAAVSHANKSNKDPYSTFDHSLRTLENALDAARSTVKHFIFFSSSMVYGNFESEAVTEEAACNPIGIYGALKFAGEKMVIAYNQVFNLPYTIVRPSALYGERCVSRRVGQIFLENAIFGKDLTIAGDGTDCLDFTYIEDLCHGIERVITSDKAKGEIFNLTYGQGRPVGEMAKMVCAAFPGVKVNYVPKDKLMPDRGTLNVEKARRLIGYNPKFPLDLGYKRYIDWYKTLKR